MIAGIAFAALVVATFAAFFITQRLKREPGVLGQVRATPFFSPNQDGRFDRARIGFLLKEPDDVTVTVEDHDGQPIRRLARNQPLDAYTQLRLAWDGRDDEGAKAPDGTYRVRVGLRRQGRSVVLPRNIELDTTPPKPKVLSIGPEQSTLPRPELLPNREGEPARVRLFLPGRRGRVLVYRTDVTPAREVLAQSVAKGVTTWEWDGTIDGRRASQGTYLVAAETRDQAGNIGTSPAKLPPKPAYGRELGGRGGISIRYLNAQPPTVPVESASQAEFGVIAGGERYTWQIRRVGQPRRANGSGTRPLVRVRAPGGKSGLYLFELRTATRRATVPFPVQAVQKEQGARGPARHDVAGPQPGRRRRRRLARHPLRRAARAHRADLRRQQPARRDRGHHRPAARRARPPGPPLRHHDRPGARPRRRARSSATTPA